MEGGAFSAHLMLVNLYPLALILTDNNATLFLHAFQEQYKSKRVQEWLQLSYQLKLLKGAPSHQGQLGLQSESWIYYWECLEVE